MTPQRPRLAAVLAFEKRRARLLKPSKITNLEDNTKLQSIRVARTNVDSAPMLIVITSRQHSSKPLVARRALLLRFTNFFAPSGKSLICFCNCQLLRNELICPVGSKFVNGIVPAKTWQKLETVDFIFF